MEVEVPVVRAELGVWLQPLLLWDACMLRILDVWECCAGDL